MKVFYALLIALAVSISTTAGAEPAETAKAVGKAQWLAIQTASSATFDGKVLTLQGAAATVTLFTDRPVRAAESLSTARFIGAWDKGGKHSFAANPPNVGVTMVAGGKVANAVLVLSNPKLAGDSVSYEARLLEGSLPASGKTVSLFIDYVCFSCLGG
jgi:hypothetical protein